MPHCADTRVPGPPTVRTGHAYQPPASCMYRRLYVRRTRTSLGRANVPCTVWCTLGGTSRRASLFSPSCHCSSRAVLARCRRRCAGSTRRPRMRATSTSTTSSSCTPSHPNPYPYPYPKPYSSLGPSPSTSPHPNPSPNPNTDSNQARLRARLRRCAAVEARLEPAPTPTPTLTLSPSLPRP